MFLLEKRMSYDIMNNLLKKTKNNEEYIDFYDEEKDEIIRNLLTPGMECVTIETKQKWDSMSTAEKTDPTKVYFLPWK